MGSEEAGAFLARGQFHYTPKQVSWLKWAGIEIGFWIIHAGAAWGRGALAFGSARLGAAAQPSAVPHEVEVHPTKPATRSWRGIA